MEPLITELEAFFNAIADKTRLQIILFLLENGEVTVNQISESLKKSQSLISHHLACLRNCGVVKMERRGKFVYYSITSDEVRQII
ncbi:MAG: metalloregulator ArsR/SmtB family transcription factor, partial [Sulfolobaceae archaeon]